VGEVRSLEGKGPKMMAIPAAQLLSDDGRVSRHTMEYLELLRQQFNADGGNNIKIFGSEEEFGRIREGGVQWEAAYVDASSPAEAINQITAEADLSASDKIAVIISEADFAAQGDQLEGRQNINFTVVPDLAAEAAASQESLRVTAIQKITVAAVSEHSWTTIGAQDYFKAQNIQKLAELGAHFIRLPLRLFEMIRQLVESSRTAGTAA
jgi:hypothetical protein